MLRPHYVFLESRNECGWCRAGNAFASVGRCQRLNDRASFIYLGGGHVNS